MSHFSNINLISYYFHKFFGCSFCKYFINYFNSFIDVYFLIFLHNLELINQKMSTTIKQIKIVWIFFIVVL